MKRFFKIITTFALAVFICLSVTACKTPLSATTVDFGKTLVEGVSTNGGTTAIHGEYLYFINGTKTNDGSSARGTTQGAICRVKYDLAAGKIAENATAEVLVSDLAGFEDGSINIFGDFLYYTTPNANVNYIGKPLYGKTDFKRYDIVNGTVQTIYTTALDDANENVDFAFYVVEDALYLLVYENVAKLVTSVKIGDAHEIAYQISDVTSCVFSDDFGKRKNADVVDANDFVFYTKAPTIEADGYETGSKVFKTSPEKNDSKWLGNKSSDDWTHNQVSILSIKNGKLVYSDTSEITGDTFLYAQVIGENTTLEFNESDIISRKAYSAAEDMIFFDELDDGNISIAAYNSTSYQIVYIEKEGDNVVPHTILNLGVKTDVDFVGMTTVVETIKNDAGEVTGTDEVEYLLYTVTSSNKVTLHKIEVKRDGVIATSPKHEVIANDDDGMVALNGRILPEAIGNNLFVMLDHENTEDEDNKFSEGVYLHMIDISKTVDEDNKINLIRKK